jgi:hypothetical protein
MHGKSVVKDKDIIGYDWFLTIEKKINFVIKKDN